MARADKSRCWPWIRTLGAAGIPLLLFRFALAPLTWAAAGPSVDEIVDNLQTTCSQTRDLRAKFRQTVTSRSLGQTTEESGVLLLKRPGKMRWEYQKPEPKLFVTDGKTLWFYRPADKEVREQAIDDAMTSRLPMAFLAGDCRLRQEFSITAVEHSGTKASPTTRILDLRPTRPEAGIARMLVEVKLQSFLVEKTTLFDAVGNTSVIAFSEIKVNSGIEDQQFRFTPPPGVTVVPPAKP
jgi:outer membrane lipoprotein carrier protein